MFEQYAAMLGITPAPLPVVWTAPADRARAAALLPSDRPVIGFGATANWAPKVWPAERFVALFRKLAEGPLPGAIPAVFAGPGYPEQLKAQPLRAALQRPLYQCGTLTLPTAAACIRRCAVFIGNDSGLMHLAAASGAPTIGLCGATMDRAAEMAPTGPRAAWALADGPTMESLSVEAAYTACVRMLETTATRQPTEL
jgi:ADP-heptose:LPS heptosyltransferase